VAPHSIATIQGSLSLPDCELALEVNGRGPDLICCHALATDRHIWKLQVETLVTHFRLITYDLRGHGLSSLSTTDDYRFESQADDVVALLDHLDIDQAGLIGISVGGEVAQVASSVPCHGLNQFVRNLLICAPSCSGHSSIG
jgi:3-oxoadipate enol-lactonase